MQKRIPHPLAPDGRDAHVPRIELGGIGQGEDFVADGLDELGVVAAGQVGAADAALEDDVAAEEPPFLAVVKRDVPGAVARGEEYLKLAFAEGDDIALLDIHVRLGAVDLRQAPQARKFIGALQVVEVEAVGHERHLKFIDQGAVAEDVVDVQVGVQDLFQPQVVVAQVIEQGLALMRMEAAGVDDDAGIRVIGDDVGVLRKHFREKGELLDLERHITNEFWTYRL